QAAPRGSHVSRRPPSSSDEEAAHRSASGQAFGAEEKHIHGPNEHRHRSRSRPGSDGADRREQHARGRRSRASATRREGNDLPGDQEDEGESPLGRRPQRVEDHENMIIVDEIVWAAYFTGQQSKHVARLDQALEKEEDLALVADRLTALLEGFRREADFRKMRQTLLQLPLVSPSVNARVEAAVLCRKLRSKRVKIE